MSKRNKYNTKLIKKQTRLDNITSKEKTRLIVLYKNNFDYLKSYNEIFPDLSGTTSEESKIKVMRNWFNLKRVFYGEYIEELIKEEFKNQYLSKETIGLKMLKIAEKNERRNTTNGDKLALDVYKFLAKMLGYSVDKIEIENIHQPIKIEYVIPDKLLPPSPEVEIKPLIKVIDVEEITDKNNENEK